MRVVLEQGAARDLTERGWPGGGLRPKTLLWRVAFDSISEAIMLADRQQRVILCNQSNARFLGMPPSDIIGHHCYELVHGTLKPAGGCPYLRVMRTLRRESSVMGIRGRWFEVAVDPVLDARGRLIGYVHIMLDVTERKRAEGELTQSLEKLQRVLEGTVQAMALAVEMRDPYTAGHQRRVAKLASAVAQEMGLSEEQVQGIRIAGLLHDIGKMRVPAEILSKPGRITESEFNLIKTHCQAGYDILNTVEFPWPAAQIVLQHHESMDGSGYPSGLSGQNILLEARILAVADVVEAMASHRPYRPALGVEKALQEVSQNSGVLYDARVVEACLGIFREKGFKLE